jgi:decaprenylphospho-beta-D-ribofuranose 2-oxidase
MNVSNWGNYPVVQAAIKSFKSVSEIRNILKTQDFFAARGNGRCYGDSSLQSTIISTLKFNHILAFDPANATITCQSGVTFDDLIQFLVPKGFFLPVTPGTKFITVGGAVASDIHGKNHHLDGSFGRHIIILDLLLASGEVVQCGPSEETELFHATCGGMGLTGMILSVQFKLKRIQRNQIEQVSIKAKNLEEIFSLFEEYKSSTYSVAWIDCLQRGKSLGRSLLMVGEHAASGNTGSVKSKSKFAIPFYFPDWVLSFWSIKLFNLLFYHKQFVVRKKSTVSLDQFFYPLDFISSWNKMYGKSGFVQYQFVLPLANSKEGMRRILMEIGKNGTGSFLAVLKLFGKQDTGIISFPMEGYTLALDFPVKPGLFDFLDRLDKIVLEYGGRIYLTKDARMKQEMFWHSYPNAKQFEKLVQVHNATFKWRSHQSSRLAITPV